MTTEAEFQRQVIDLAELLGWMTYHTYSSKHSAAGYPDLTLIRPPRLIFAELKAEAGKVTDEQEEWLTAIRLCEHDAYVWRPSDLAYIASILK